MILSFLVSLILKKINKFDYKRIIVLSMYHPMTEEQKLIIDEEDL